MASARSCSPVFHCSSSRCALLLGSRDKKWHFTFALLLMCHLLLFGLALATARWQRRAMCASRHGDDIPWECTWWATPRLMLLAAQTLRPIILISQLRTVRRVFINILRQAAWSFDARDSPFIGFCLFDLETFFAHVFFGTPPTVWSPPPPPWAIIPAVEVAVGYAMALSRDKS